MEEEINESLSIHITFPLVPGQPCDPTERYRFWSLPVTIDWFKRRGYALYQRSEDGIFEEAGTSKPALPFEPYNDAKHPYAFYDAEISPYEKMVSPPQPLLAEDQTGKIAFAQDSSNRHVAIKLVRADTDEYRVLRFLHEQSMNTLEENCVIPVLELLPTEGYWFAVMPRWGTEVYNPVFTLLAEALDLVHSMLKGLVFLHKNNIAHGDIAVHNILVSHFSDFRTMRYSSWRAKLRGERRLSYALFDFDHSTMFPRTADKRECRLPYHKSWGTFSIGVGDTDAGEYDYDPFAFDVAGMGVQLRDLYNSLTPIFPAFVPLFNMMTTWDVSHRFTATQALEFFESQMSELPETQLGRYIDNELEGYVPDPWATLPPDLAEKWKMYKMIPQPWLRRLLCWVACRRWMWHIVPWIRWVSFQSYSAATRQIYRWLCRENLVLT